MIELYERNIRNFCFVKYIRDYLLNYYNELHQKNTFVNQNVDMYFKRTASRSLKKRRTKIKINKNSNANLKKFNNYNNVNNENVFKKHNDNNNIQYA